MESLLHILNYLGQDFGGSWQAYQTQNKWEWSVVAELQHGCQRSVMRYLRDGNEQLNNLQAHRMHLDELADCRKVTIFRTMDLDPCVFKKWSNSLRFTLPCHRKSGCRIGRQKLPYLPWNIL